MKILFWLLLVPSIALAGYGWDAANVGGELEKRFQELEQRVALLEQRSKGGK